MIKVYFEESDVRRYVPLIYSYFTSIEEQNKNLPYATKALDEISERFVERVTEPAEADFFLIPNTLKLVKDNKSYIKKVRTLAGKYNKKILVFAFEDHYKHPGWPEAVVFRTSGYRSDTRESEFGLPYIVEDLSKDYPLTVRKKPEIPIVGFVGWAKFNSSFQEFRSKLRNFLNLVFLFLIGTKNVMLRRKGLLLRSEVMKNMQADERLKVNFIIRDNYGGNVKTTQDPVKNRQEFIENLIESDVIFCPRGEANASQRFYEALSMGRIPLVIDTDVDFPLKSVIPYESFVIMVPYKDRMNAGKYVEAFFAELNDESYAEIQKMAQHYFKKYLSLNGFYSYLFVDEEIRKLIEFAEKR